MYNKRRIFLVEPLTNEHVTCKKKIDHQVSPDKLNSLAQIIHMGDTVIIHSIEDTFQSFSQMEGFIGICQSKQVSFESMMEKSLNFSVEKPMRLPVSECVQRVHRLLYEFQQCYVGTCGSRHTPNEQHYVISLADRFSLMILCSVLRNEITKR